MEIIEKFGIDWKTLLAQIINFLIVLGVLYKFAYKPILKLLHERTRKIAKSLKTANEMEEKLGQLAQTREKIIKEAKEQAQTILKQAEKQGQTQSALLISQAKKDSQDLLQKTESEIQTARADLINEAQKDLAVIVYQSLNKIIAQKWTSHEDQQLIEKTVAEVKNKHLIQK